MKKILVCCNSGVSTTLLVSKLEAAAKADGGDIEVVAYPLAKGIEHLSDADVVLLAPQVAFAQPNLAEGTDAPVRAIDPDEYARMDVAAILAQAKELLSA